MNFTVKEPFGVVAAIVPFNYPLLLMSWKVAPALAAGNTIVIKPAEETPLATLTLAEAFRRAAAWRRRASSPAPAGRPARRSCGIRARDM